MDFLFPYIQRPTGTPAQPSGPMITPVFKDARISAYDESEKRFLILLKQQKKKQQDQQHSEHQSHPTPTAPATTPEEDQHVDEDGHLDIFI